MKQYNAIKPIESGLNKGKLSQKDHLEAQRLKSRATYAGNKAVLLESKAAELGQIPAVDPDNPANIKGLD